jgi:uncharacterized membrane protein YuzA (DUF378 family)
MKRQCIRGLVLVVLIIGALNWGLVGFLRYNLIGDLFGGTYSTPARAVFAIVGLCGLYAITFLCKSAACCCTCGSSCHSCNSNSCGSNSCGANSCGTKPGSYDKYEKKM